MIRLLQFTIVSSSFCDQSLADHQFEHFVNQANVRKTKTISFFRPLLGLINKNFAFQVCKLQYAYLILRYFERIPMPVGRRSGAGRVPVGCRSGAGRAPVGRR